MINPCTMIYVAEGPGVDVAASTLLAEGFDTVILYGEAVCNPIYGWQSDDYTDGTLLFLASEACYSCGPVCHGRECPRVLAFRPDIFRDTPLEKEMSDHTIFRYRQEEALHLSAGERRVIEECMDGIECEVRRADDDYSRQLLSKRIGLLIDYGIRFYERQFTTRHLSVQEVLKRYRRMVGHFIEAGGLRTEGILSAARCAERLGLSEAYFCDLLKFETGLSHVAYLDRTRLSFARKWLRDTEYPLARIASELGFPSVRRFSLFFQKVEGCSPSDFRYSS